MLAAFVVAVPLPPRAAAEPAPVAPAAGTGRTGSTGAYSTSIPIEVPDFRGLEPDLELSYDSGTGNGFAGMGWTLAGSSFVERAGPGRGVPRYNAADIFLLDGQELVACTALGGTHCTRQQEFLRIRQDTAGDRWEVWDTDGTRSLYTPVYLTGRGTFRWALTEERDTHGNLVTYTYVRPAPDNAYLDSISYNGTLIKLWRQARPSLDAVSFTNGDTVAATSMRLKTIDISTGGARVRAYRLTYGQGPTTGRSRLTSVQEYGRDAVVDATGTVTGGTALPAVVLSYQDGEARFGGASAIGPVGGWDPALIKDLFGDVDGDGRTDLVRIYKNGSQPAGHDAYAQVNKSVGSGFGTANSNAEVGGWATDTRNDLVDVTGDGRADLVRTWHCGTNTCIQVRPSDGRGFPADSFNASVGSWNTLFKDSFGDVDGDYRADFVREWKNGTKAYVQVNKSNGSGYPTQNWNSEVGGWSDSTLTYLADVSGDSRADLIRIWDAGSAFAQVRLSDGSGFPETTFNASVGGWNPGHVYNHFADLNGDGKADLVRIWDNGGAYAQVSLSTGLGYPTVNSNGPVGGWNPAVTTDTFADVSGDGRSDLVRVYRNGDQAYAEIRPYDGKGFATPSAIGSIGGWDTTWKTYLVDVSGDGKADAVRIWHRTDAGAYQDVKPAAGATPDLLTGIANGIGGTTSVAYSPSSRWWSDGHALPGVFPTVSTVTESDGRGTSFGTQYTFADGLWARHPAERRFLGFGSSRAVVDGDGTVQETFYRQTLASAGRVERSLLRTAGGQVYHSTSSSYVENAAPPYLSQVSRTEHSECNLTATCRVSRTDMSYDGYGNEVLEVEHGDVARTGDELTTATTYAPNTTAYIVDRPATVTSHAGTSTAGTQVTRSVFFYDTATSATTPPVRGDRTRQDDWNSDTGGYVTARWAHDGWGNTVSTTDTRGAASTSVFDPTYHLFETRECNALNHCTDTVWDTVLGEPTSVTDPNDAETRYGYDPLGRQTSRTDPAGAVTTWQYLDVGNPAGQRVREAQPDGTADGLWQEVYTDGLGRAWQTVKEGPSAGVTYVQDRAYRATTDVAWKESLWRQSGQAARYTVFAHDGADRVVRTTHPGGAFVTTSYTTGADGLPSVTTRDELGHERTTWSDVDDGLTMVRERNGSASYTTTYTTDVLGRLTGWTDATGNRSTVRYNSLGWRTGLTDMDTGTWTYGYDNGGLLTSQTDAKGQTVTSGYDPLGRLTTRTEPGGRVSRWFYDETGHGAAVGRLTRTTYPAGSDAHSWNSLGLETATTQCVDTVCKSLSRTYDPAGRLATLTYPDGEAVAHSYNAAGQLTAVGGYVTSMAWNPAGRLTGLTYGNGTTTGYTYDPDREWLTTAAVTAGANQRYQATYTYNAAGLVTSMTQGTPGSATTTYAYDDLNRLLSVSGAQNRTYTYDPIGNITSSSTLGSYVYGDPAHKHAVTAAGGANYAYDANGNMISGDGRTFTWDSANRLAGVTAGGATTTFAYDAGERRLKKVTGPSTTRYFGTTAEEVNGQLVKYYYAGEILVARSAGGSTTWYHADRLGSTRLMTNASGAEVRDYDYQPYGEASSTGTAANERTFTGHVSDDATGLIYMVARYQDPELGRFVSPDAVIPDIGEPQDINRYSYVRNNPVNNVDPTGHAPCDEIWCYRNKDGSPKKKPAPPKRVAPKKKSVCDEIWCYRKKDGSPKKKSSPPKRVAPKKKKSVCDEIWCYRKKDGSPKKTVRRADVSSPGKQFDGRLPANRPSALAQAWHNVVDWYRTPRYTVRWGRLAAAYANTVLGARVFVRGAVMFAVGGVVTFTVPILGPVSVPAAGLGATQMGLGGARVLRGAYQAADVKVEPRTTLSGRDQINDFVGGIIPRPDNWLDFLGGLAF